VSPFVAPCRTPQMNFLILAIIGPLRFFNAI
jgi:hypothetical protein